MDIVFLGTGGGRFNLVCQQRRTAGFRINGPITFHIDPGPGALSASLEFSQAAERIDYILSTHNHIDHVNDAGLMVEAMTGGALRRRGGIIAPKSVLVADEYGERAISSYHLEKLCEKIVAKPGKPFKVSRNGASAEISPFKVRHEDSTGFGFTLRMAGVCIGYTSDTEYYKGLSRHLSGCDILIANNLKASEDEIPGHLCSGTTARLLSECKPGLAVITNLGMGIIQKGPQKEAEKISTKSGVETIAAQDGLRIALPSLAQSILPPLPRHEYKPKRG